MTRFLLAALLGILCMTAANSATAQAPATPAAPAPSNLIPYGEPISLADAKKVIAAATVEANKNNWPVAIAIVDGGGHLVAFERLDNTQYGSIEVAQQKAVSAALFRRPTKVFEDGLVTGGANLRVLKLPGGLPIEGGIPLVRDGKLIGAIGVSGVKSTEDGIVAAAGVEGLKK